MNIKQTQKGFTLIELMIVIAIIGILAAVALPAYSSYTTKAKTAEVILAASTCRNAVTEIYAYGSAGPGANLWGCGEASTLPATTLGVTKYVLGAQTDANGVVTITADSDVLIGTSTAASTIILTPYWNNAGTAEVMDVTDDMGKAISEWKCTAGAGLAPFAPASCK